MPSSEAHELLERTRMALAEVGHDPDLAKLYGDHVGITRTGPNPISRLDIWRATSIARRPGDKHICWTCRSAAPDGDGAQLEDAFIACRASAPLVRNCGLHDDGDDA